MKLLICAILLGLIIPSHGIFGTDVVNELLPLPLPILADCAANDWTAWYDVDTPTGDGDFESLSLIIERNPENMCEQPTHIEGRVVRSQVDAKNSGQTLTLNPSVGLICRNAQNLARCQDYEVRFCCPKSQPTCVNGKWTNFFSSDTPDDRGDFETLENVRLLDPSVCENPTSVDARRISDSLHWSVLGRGRITKTGFECNNNLLILLLSIVPNYRCDDYEVRFCCPHPNPPQCGPEDWTPWLNGDNPADGCDVETLPILSQQYPDVICEFPEAMDARLVESGLHFDPTLPNIRFGKFGLKCCDRFGKRCGDYEVRFCCPKVEPPVECDGKWTRYFDRDNPSGKGDYETLKNLREEYPNEICQHPSAVDAKLVGSDIHYPIPGLTTTANTEEGFYCVNINQFERDCLDFEVRFCCSEDEPSECDEADWTDFYDIDDPTGLDQCDCENLPTLIKRHPEVCPDPTAMDVKLKNGADIASVNQLVHLSLTEGFQCYNFEQNTDESCCDYKVRYCCPSGEPPSICDVCTEWNGTWTEYFNVDQPIQDSEGCDCELLSTIRENYRDVCEYPIAIDARPFHVKNRQTPIQDVEVSLLGGFRCKNTDEQLCKDYKIRFCCPKDPYVIGPLSWCTASGDPHYTSLDGRRFDFQGICTYSYVSTTEEAVDCHLYPFSIEVENEHRGTNTAVSLLKKIIIRLESEVIELRKPGVAYVNSEPILLPYEESFFGYTIQEEGSYLVFTMKFGVVVRYDGNHVINVGVPDNYEGKVEGLCGNYNGNPSDDFMIRENKMLTDDVNEFAISYKTDQDCMTEFEDPRECSGEEEELIIELCWNIINSECFETCLGEINIGDVIEDCVFDACAQNDIEVALEQATDTIVEMCLVNGFDCSNDGNGCGDPPGAPTNGHLENINLPPNDAGLFPFGSVATYECLVGFQERNRNFVVCLESGQWQILGLECLRITIGPLSWCTGSGDPHYTSFDGRRFDFQGICTYSFVTTTELAVESNLQEFAIEVENENRFGVTSVSYLKRIIVNVGMDTIYLEKPGVAIIDSEEVTLPFEDPDSNYAIRRDRGFLVLEMAMDVLVRYDGDQLISVGVPSNYEEKVEGLCGNYNRLPDDDFLIRGTDIVSTEVNEFASSYQTDSNCTTEFQDLPLFCDETIGRRCESAFAPVGCLETCLSEFDLLDLFFQNCVFDACALNNVDLAVNQTLAAAYERCFIVSDIDCIGTDIDECDTSLNDCDINAFCTNTIGSFTCTCNRGFLGDGKTCTGPSVDLENPDHTLFPLFSPTPTEEP